MQHISTNKQKKEIMDIATKEIQVGGDHYQGYDYQPLELIEDLGLSFAEGNILKYAIRFRDKGGKEDLLKALDYAKRELLKPLEQEPEKRKVDRKAIGFIVTFVSQDRINREDRDFILDVAKYLHAGMMTKVAEVIMGKIERLYIDKDGMPKKTLPSATVEQLKQIKEAADHVLKEVRAREESQKDDLIDRVQAEHESYMDMNLMLQIIRDTITF